MEYLTEWLGKRVTDAAGHRVVVEDLVAVNAEPLPEVVAIGVKVGADRTTIPLQCFSPFDATHPYRLGPDNFNLRKSVLDKQILDLHGKRVVRVNDVAIIRRDNRLFVVGVEAGLLSLLRRIRLDKAALKLPKRLRRRLLSQIIPWNEIEAFGRSVKLKVPHEKIAQLHPADIADIVEQLDPAQRAQVFEVLDVETAADTLEETEPEVQKAIIESLDVDRAADIVEEMDPDEAADLLGDLDTARTEELLEHMEAEEAEDVKQLLEYDDDTAGGMMTTEFVAVPQTLTAAQTIDRLREIHPDAEMIYYIYVLNDDEQLVGVLSLRDLIIAPADKAVSEIMVRNVRSVHTNTEFEAVVEMIGKYSLLAIPVLDLENRLRGIITVDDTFDLLMPEWPRRRHTGGQD